MSGILSEAGKVAYKTAFQISPILLTGGIAAQIGGGILPIVAITQAATFVAGLLSGGGGLDLDAYFAHFRPAPGSTLIDNQLGEYPFANQQTAANAIIGQPLVVSLTMDCPVQVAGGYAAKLVTFIGLQATLKQHGDLGGLYTVATPSFLYTNAILLRVVDISSGDTKQAQTRWQWDFRVPLVTLAQAQAAQNTQMNKITQGTQTDGSLSGPSASPGNLNTNTQPLTGGMAGYGLGG